jgi:hypothetical protein
MWAEAHEVPVHPPAKRDDEHEQRAEADRRRAGWARSRAPRRGPGMGFDGSGTWSEQIKRSIRQRGHRAGRASRALFWAAVARRGPDGDDGGHGDEKAVRYESGRMCQ